MSNNKWDTNEEYRRDDPDAPWNKPKIGNSRKYKNTRKWCKGKAGREHVYKAAQPWVGYHFRRNSDGTLTRYEHITTYDICQVCGKKDNYKSSNKETI